MTICPKCGATMVAYVDSPPGSLSCLNLCMPPLESKPEGKTYTVEVKERMPLITSAVPPRTTAEEDFSG